MSSLIASQKIKRYVVYTAVFGGYDRVSRVDEKWDCDFICFTDTPSNVATGWDIIPIEIEDDSPILTNRKYKLLPHRYLSQYEASLYVDSNIDIRRDPTVLFNKYRGETFLSLKHLERNCIYEEAKLLFGENRLTREEKKTLEIQVKRYAKAGFPAEYGLSENTILLRRNQENVNELMEAWWQEFKSGVYRDQISLFYLLWRSGIDVTLFDEHPRKRQAYFQIRLHTNEKKLSPVRQLIRICRVRKYQHIFYRAVAAIADLAGKKLHNKGVDLPF